MSFATWVTCDCVRGPDVARLDCDACGGRGEVVMPDSLVVQLPPITVDAMPLLALYDALGGVHSPITALAAVRKLQRELEDARARLALVVKMASGLDVMDGR